VYLHEPACRENIFPRAIRDLRRILAEFRRTALLACALALAAPLAASAQGTAVPPRVTDRVDVTRLATLSGNTHPLARAQYDQGAAPADLPMNRIMLVLKRSADQEAALQDLLVQQQVTSSVTFHKWLTPDQFGQQFGLADADIQAVTSWLASFGFQSIKVSKGRNVIEFSGTAAQVEAGLHTSIHKYFVNGENHWANSSDPQIPAALAPVISGVVSLHNFRPKPTIVRSDRKLTATVTPGAKPQINFTDGSHGLAPADFNTIYNVANTMTGSGVTIGIIASSNINVQDVHDFRSLFFPGLPTNDPIVIPNGPIPVVVSGSPGEGEAVLDATWTGAVAPLATVDLVVSEDTNASPGIDLSEFYIIDNNLADVMTESFSVCESQFLAQNQLTAAANFYNFLAEQAAAQGITFLVASGDGGPDGCDDPSTEPATTAASVNLLASTPFDVAVGGTMFNDTANPNTYWGPNLPNHGSALSYIPENVWNESCTALSATCPAIGLWSSGGGQSIAFTTAPPWQAGVTGLPASHPRLVPDVALTAADHDGYVLCIDASCQSNPAQFAIASGTSASAQSFGGIMALVVQKMAGRVGIANYALYNLAHNETLSACNGSNVLPALPPASTCVFNDVTVGNTNVPGEAGFTAGVGYDETTGLGSVNVSNLVNKWNTAIVKATTTTLTLNGGTAVNITHGSLVPVGITVSPVVPATVAPTGDVSLLANSSTDLGVDVFTLSPGAVNSTVNSNTFLLPGGTYQVHAHYEGDGTFLGSDSTLPWVTVTVNPEGSQINFGIVVTTATTCSTPTSVAYGSSYVLTVDVADLNVVSTPCAPSVSGSSPSGTVTLTDSFNGGAAAALDGGSFKLNSFGYFEDQIIQLPVGTHIIKVSYLGDNSFSASGPASGVITVTKASTTAKVTSSATSVAANTAFSLTVVVDTLTSTNPAIGSSGAAPTGMVTFTATTTATVFNPARRHWPEPNRFIVGEVCAALACLFALIQATKRRRGVVLLGMTMLIVIAVGTSCGSSSTTSTTTMTLGTANVSATTDANGFAAATATLSNVKLATTGTITATYAGDGNYNGSTSPVVTVTVQ
jgi:hypothetical protein